MKKLKTALICALSVISSNVLALEILDDDSMSAATGQDGISISILPPTQTTAQLAALGVSAATTTKVDVGGTAGTLRAVSLKSLIIHDDDGLGAATVTGTGTGNSGALVMGFSGGLDSNVLLIDDNTAITFQINAIGDNNGTTALGSAMLNIAVSIPRFAFTTGGFYVANSTAAEAGRSANGVITGGSLEVDGGTLGTISGQVLFADPFEIVMGASTVNIQLASEIQGSMLKFNSTVVGGIEINDFRLYDGGGTVTGGAFKFDSLKLTDSALANLTVDVDMDIGGLAAPSGEGLYLTLTQVGSVANGADMVITNLSFGGATSPIIGDVGIDSLKISGTRVIITGI